MATTYIMAKFYKMGWNMTKLLFKTIENPAIWMIYILFYSSILAEI